MKKSKKLTTRLITNFLKSYFPNFIYPHYLFLKTFKNFKRKTTNPKQFDKFSNNLDQINQNEFKITSQNNEDGIIEYIFNIVPNNKHFVEIGFGYYEFNSLNLIKKGWEGKLIDTNIDEAIALKKNLTHYYPSVNVEVVNVKILKDNINKLIYNKEKKKWIDFFSLDIDSNDYWILKSVDLSQVSVLCCEYNHWLGKERKLTIPHNDDFKFVDNGIWGASLLAITELLKDKDFSLIAVESSGTNAFFINNKYRSSFEILSPLKSYKSVGRFYNEDQKNKIFENVKSSKLLLEIK
tara:strand:+ start:3592 stop:4473 length:882 start_codon:yes stop_codon:yes gene_type:complete